MPLPETTIALGPHTNPGESEHSKPKIAMLLRLSTETLDALQALGEKPPMDFEFGDAPGIHIGGAFYPMRPLKEETPHELYLRTHSATKPNAPLKLYANVTGKFTIEHDKLGDNLKGKIRERTMEGVKQRDNHKTQFIDVPPTNPTKNTKKRGQPTTSNMFRNAVRPSDQTRLNASTSSSAPPARVASPTPISSKKPVDPTLRIRLMRCVAQQEWSRDEIVKKVAGTDSADAVIELLAEIGEQTSPLKKGEKLGMKTWCLKRETWFEVRPYSWPGLSDAERKTLARTGRSILTGMGIKESDPRWEHVAFRPQISGVSATAGSSRTNTGTPNVDTKQRQNGEVVAKRGVSSKELKEKKARPKADPNAEIQMRDESKRAVPRVSNSNGKAKEAEETSPRPSASGSARKVPGSGFRLGKASTQLTNSASDESSRASSLQGKVTEKGGDAHRPSLPHKPTPPSQESSKKEKAVGSTVPTQRIRKLREYDATVASDSERQKDSDRTKDPMKTKGVVKQQGGEERRSTEIHTLKKRPAPTDGIDSEAPISVQGAQKRRRMENGPAAPPSSSSSSKGAQPRDLSLPKKPDIPMPPRQKPRKDPSPQPPLPKINKKETPSSRPTQSPRDGKLSPQDSTSSTHSHSRGRGETKPNGLAAKRRRGSPIYTSSSEDEGGTRKSTRDAPSASLLTPPMTTFIQHSTTPTSRMRAHEPRSLPADHAGLRVRYSSMYNEYMSAYVKVIAQKNAIEKMLKEKDAGEFDGDVEVLDVEELKKLVGDRDRLGEELSAIRGMFAE